MQAILIIQVISDTILINIPLEDSKNRIFKLLNEFNALFFLPLFSLKQAISGTLE
jgi:hypothetical protein